MLTSTRIVQENGIWPFFHQLHKARVCRQMPNPKSAESYLVRDTVLYENDNLIYTHFVNPKAWMQT